MSYDDQYDDDYEQLDDADAYVTATQGYVGEAEQLLRQAIDVIATAPTMPLSSSPRIDRDEIIELLEDALHRLPAEVRQARWMIKERQEFVAKTRRYRDYSYEKFVDEYSTMSTVMLCYYLAFGGPILQQGAVNNAMAARVEFGGKGATEADLPPEELRQRMWWAKAYANFGENFKTFNQYPLIAGLPENLTGLGEWVDLPAHLR